MGVGCLHPAGFALLGSATASENQITNEEIRTLLAEATKAGVVEPAEQAMISGVMRLADRPVRMIMTPRPNIVWLDLDNDPSANLQQLLESHYSRFPVGRGNIDEVIGVVQTKDLLNTFGLGGKGLDLEGVLREPAVVPYTVGRAEGIGTDQTIYLENGRVVDEYGNLKGLVTATDILESDRW